MLHHEALLKIFDFVQEMFNKNTTPENLCFCKFDILNWDHRYHIVFVFAILISDS
jgi:hypothetical protein